MKALLFVRLTKLVPRATGRRTGPVIAPKVTSGLGDRRRVLAVSRIKNGQHLKLKDGFCIFLLWSCIPLIFLHDTSTYRDRSPYCTLRMHRLTKGDALANARREAHFTRVYYYFILRPGRHNSSRVSNLSVEDIRFFDSSCETNAHPRKRTGRAVRCFLIAFA